MVIVTPEPVKEAVTPITRISFQDYLRLYDGWHAEWHNGQVEEIKANNLRHQELFAFLITFFELYFGFRPIGKVLAAAFSMYISDAQPAREPDLMIILNEHRDRIKPTYLDGAADIAIEIVSPESTERDYGAKFAEYEKAGVREYWLFDPIRQQADIYVLHPDGVYRRAGYDAQGRLTSTLLVDFKFDPAMLWRESLPTGMELVKLLQGMVSET